MGTYVRAPHVSRPAARIRALRANPAVAISIDSDTQPPQVLSIRGQAVVTEQPGAVAEYAEAAHRAPNLAERAHLTRQAARLNARR